MKIIGRKKVAFLIYAEIYLEYSRTNKAPATYWRHDRNNMGNLGRTFGKRRLGDITPLMIEAYKTERLTRVSPATVNRELATLRHMFRKAVEWGYVKASPMVGVGGLKEPPGR
ncbi:MAG: phage integrase SAM-like domain-containing protein, partial [Candidatus Aminicenantes bacterium]|nr:phage integrase SAM-like domain-containing protein [Candidatus Aminicenantes bacterium]